MTLLYTVGLTLAVSFVVGGTMYLISSRSLRRAYESRFEASARGATYQLVDPVYRLDAYAVLRLRILLSESDPSLRRSLVVDAQGRPFGGWSEWRQEEIGSQLEAVRRSSSWILDTEGESWRFVGPVTDVAGQIHGLAAFEYSTDLLRRDLNQAAGAALTTALLATLVVCLIGLVLARRATRPFSRLVETVQEIGEQRFHTPVRVSSFIELGDLAEAINRMADQLDKTTVSLEEAETARREAERANHLKTRFLANLSHEVRTPLHAIVGHVDLLREEGVDPEQEERVDGIRVAAGALQALIEDILDLSTIESGNLVIADEPLDLVRLVHEVIEITEVRADPGTLDLFGLVAPGVVRQRRGDPDRIKQVLVNLVSNGLKFTTRGHVVLEVIETRPGRVRFVVHDTGRGIPAAEIETIFQPFARMIVDSASISGSGLGLPICRQLAHAMSAQLWLDSVEGEGTRATFEIPLETIRDAERPARRPRTVRLFGFPPRVRDHLLSWFRGEAGAGESSGADPGGDGDEIAVVYLEGCEETDVTAATLDIETVLVFSPSGRELPRADQARTGRVPVIRMPVTTLSIEQALEVKTPCQLAAARATFAGLEVLIVEDDPVNQIILSSMLQRLGCRVRTAGNGQEGVEAWRRYRPSIVLMDCSMPVLDGFEATRQIRLEEARENGGKVPILAVTAYTLRRDRIRCREAGMSSFLSKPLAFEQLREALGAWSEPSAPTGGPRAESRTS